jgi:hypothetical protein
MNSTASGKGTEKKGASAAVQAKPQSGTSCAFCSFILTVYPTLKGLNPRDEELYLGHLRENHGLHEDIQP